MVTKYILPCSVCGKPQERYIFCSGACKTKGYMDRKKKEIEEFKVNTSFTPKKLEDAKEEQPPVPDQAVERLIKPKKIAKTTTYGVAICEHGRAMSMYCEECGS